MKTSDLIILLVLAIIAYVGIRMNTFTGGIIAGACGSMAVMATLGKYLAHKAGEKIDRNIKRTVASSHDVKNSR